MRYQFQSGDRTYEIILEGQGENLQATVEGQSHAIEVLDAQPGQISLRVDGKPVIAYWAVDSSGVKWISLEGCTYRLEKPTPKRSRPTTEADGSESARAPMPAQVRAVQVAEGDTVQKGQTILLLEAMKMEIRIKAPAAGRVSRLLVTAGQQVEKDQPLVEILPES
jgi:acetyl/propionyl-CoA carboxylase alpha subunit